MLCLSIISYVFSSTKLRREQSWFYLEARRVGSRGGVQGREVAQTMYAYMNKCINKKI
jgi:hypothetical protein